MVILSLVTVAFVENIDPHEDDSQYAYGENLEATEDRALLLLMLQ